MCLPAFWVGLLYDHEALKQSLSIIDDWSYEEVSRMRDMVPVSALDTPFREGTLKDLAKSILEISEQGLKRRKNLDEKGRDETVFLKSLKAIAETGITPAQEILEKYSGEWGHNIDRIFEEYSY